MTTQEKNEVIAQLCGGVRQKNLNLRGYPIYTFPENFHVHGKLWSNGNRSTGYLEFNESWDWIHAAVKVVRKLMPDIKLPRDLEAMKNGTHGSEQHISVLSIPLDTPIEEAFNDLYEFANWHNNKTK